MNILRVLTLATLSIFMPLSLTEARSGKSNKPAHKNTTYKHKNDCDVDWIIVGAGSAGVPCAWALTNDKKTSVLLLESGDDHTDDPIITNPDLFAPTGDGFFAVVAQATANDPKFAYNDVTAPKTQSVVYTHGHTLGGSSATNYLQAIRGTPESYNNWAALSGNPAWRYENLLPLFKSQEKFVFNDIVPNTEQRGLDGRLYIAQQLNITPGQPGANAFYDAVAKAYEVPYIDDYNSHPEIAPGVYDNLIGISANQQWTTAYCPANNCGERSQVGKIYLKGMPSVGIPPIVDSNLRGTDGRKLQVRTKATISRVLLKGNKACGVEVVEVDTHGNITKTEQIKAKRGVILSAGAVMTPAILQRSGIGKPSDLTPLGIDVKIPNDHVGYNLENQYGVDVLVRKNSAKSLPLKVLTQTWSDIRDPEIPGSGDGKRRCLTNILPGSLVSSATLGVIGITAGDAFVNYQDLLSFMMLTKSRGSVKIRSSNPVTYPLVDLNMYSDTDGPGGTSQDLADAVRLYKLGKIAANNDNTIVAYPPANHYPAPYGPAPDNSLLELDAKSQGRISNHIGSTCRMSSSPQTGVVNGTLKVWGTDNLYIADASIQPQLTDSSPGYICIMIGLQLAKFLGADLP